MLFDKLGKLSSETILDDLKKDRVIHQLLQYKYNIKAKTKVYTGLQFVFVCSQVFDRCERIENRDKD